MNQSVQKKRGADILIDALKLAGVGKIFSLSGNHIMSLYDAALDSSIQLIHVRHEGATVHMAESWARLTGEVGIAMVTGGPGHANAIGALCTALASETPVILLSGHAPLSELGLGAFQEFPQTAIAEPVCKASWTALSAAGLGNDLARAFRLARSGRPGPVHISLPSDLLEQVLAEGDLHALPAAVDYLSVPMHLPSATASMVVAEVHKAKRPLLITSPALCTTPGRAMVMHLQAALGAPVVGMESPRGINDPSLGAFAEVLAQADLVVLLGKPLDFTLRFGNAPVVAASCNWIVIDPDAALIVRAARGRGERLVLSAIADASNAVLALTAAAKNEAKPSHQMAWLAEVQAAISYRPAQWQGAMSNADAPMHAVDLCRVLQPVLDQHADAVFVSDGGEIGQWAQACLRAPHRVINGVCGAIGPALPFALAAQAAYPGSPVIAVIGDGTFGFHMAEFDTAVRENLPLIAVVGNDARWNAEYQIQVRTYGEARAHGCTLSPATRYDLVAVALGGHGEFVTCIDELPAAIDRAIASGKPACINVLIDGSPAPVIRR
ncbi:acetolactate synthase large subunit IlvG [mine drainage metagenome]|uniref:Acetolactate synthase large subunit IlvG n=1 Tax=mine drainage metagenome TaxID=410659 RepID=A0A1J5RI67_9ZZZZ